VDFGAVALEADLVHQLVNEENAAAVMGIYILTAQRVRNFYGIEAGPGIAHNDEHAVLFIARNATLDPLGGVVLTTVENGVGECFTQGGLDLKFLASSTFHAAGHFHDALYHGTNAGCVGVERNLNAYHQVCAIRPDRRQAAGRRFLPTECRQRYSDRIGGGGQAVILKMVVF